MLAQSQCLPEFDVRDFINYLTPSDKRDGKYLCPNCGKNDFSFNKDTGAYSCYSGCKDNKTIFKILLENYGSQVYGEKYINRSYNTLNDSKTFYRDSKQNNKTVPKYEYVDFEYIEPVTGLIEDPKDKKEFCDLLPRYALPYRHPKRHNFFFDYVTQKRKRWFYFEYDETLRICREEIKDRPSHSDKEYRKTFKVEARVHGLWKNVEEWIKVNQDFDPYYFRKFLYKWKDVENTYNIPNDLLYLEPENKFPRALVMAEGEKCVDVLDYYGFLATTVIGCKANCLETLEKIASWLYFIGVPAIYYLLDNDETGYSKFESLRKACAVYKMPVIPICLADVYKNLPLKGDIVDFLESEFFVDNYLWLEGEEHKMHPDDIENLFSRKGGYYPSRNLVQERLVRLIEIQVKEYLKNHKGQVPIPLTVEESEEDELEPETRDLESQLQLYNNISNPRTKAILRSKIEKNFKFSSKQFDLLIESFDLEGSETKNLELEDVIKTAKQLLTEDKNEAYDWLIPDYLAKGTFIVLSGDSGVGKSYMGYNLAYSLATKSPFLGIQPTRKANTLIFSLDESSKTTNNRLRMLGFEDLEQVSFLDQKQIDWKASSNGIAQLDKFLSKNKFDLLIIDCLMQIKPDDIEENSEKVGHLIKNLRKVTERHDVACLLLHHAKKDSEKGQFRGHSSIKDLCDDLWQLTTEKDKDGKSYNLISPQKGRFGTKNKIKYRYDTETLEIYDCEILDKDFNSKKEIEDEQKDFKLTLDEKILLILCGADNLENNNWLKELYSKHRDCIQFEDVFKLYSVKGEENWVTSNTPLTAKEIVENLHYLGSQSHTSIVGAKEVKLTFIRKQLSTLVSKGLIKTETLEESKHNEKFYYFSSNS